LRLERQHALALRHDAVERCIYRCVEPGELDQLVGADGIDAVNGITTFNEGYSVSGAMVTAANKVIAVLDSSKFNRRGFNQVLPIEKIDIIITDDAVSEVDKLALQKTRVKLITV